MQLNTASTTAENVEQPRPQPKAKHPDQVGLVCALVLAAFFFLWFSADLQRERAWFAERKKRLDWFRNEAARRHAEVRDAILRETLAAPRPHATAPATKTPKSKTPVDAAPKQRKIFKLYG